MKKVPSGAAKTRERKKIKLEQVAHDCSQNISNLFNAMARKTSKLVSKVILMNYIFFYIIIVNKVMRFLFQQHMTKSGMFFFFLG